MRHRRSKRQGLKLDHEGLEIVNIRLRVAHVARKNLFVVKDFTCFIENFDYLLQAVRYREQARVVS